MKDKQINKMGLKAILAIAIICIVVIVTLFFIGIYDIKLCIALIFIAILTCLVYSVLCIDN